jgi:hypothetical protein
MLNFAFSEMQNVGLLVFDNSKTPPARYTGETPSYDQTLEFLRFKVAISLLHEHFGKFIQQKAARCCKSHPIPDHKLRNPSPAGHVACHISSKWQLETAVATYTNSIEQA